MKRIFVIAVLLILNHAVIAMADGTANSMSMITYQRLQVIEELMADNQLQKAAKKLDDMLADMPQRKLDCAYVHYTCAMLHLQQNDYLKAKSHFKNAYDLNCFPEKTMLYVLQNLAGLCMQEEDFKTAVTYYRDYLSRSPEPNKNIYLGLGTALFHLQEYAAAIEVLTTAVGQFKPQPSPYLMLFSSYYELHELSRAAEVLEKMIRLWPEKPQYWLQLAGIYIEQEAYDQSIEIMEAALAQKHITKESDLLQYVYLLFEKQLSYKAATVLEKAISAGIAGETRKNYEMLATLYQEARERPKAIEALKQASMEAQDGKNDLSVAQLCFEMDDAYGDVIAYGQRAIEKGVKQPGNAHMLIAIAYCELGQVESAKTHLAEAGRYKETQKESAQWLQFISETNHP